LRSRSFFNLASLSSSKRLIADRKTRFSSSRFSSPFFSSTFVLVSGIASAVATARGDSKEQHVRERESEVVTVDDGMAVRAWL